jgi:hypothetical protein
MICSPVVPKHLLRSSNFYHTWILQTKKPLKSQPIGRELNLSVGGRYDELYSYNPWTIRSRSSLLYD